MKKKKLLNASVILFSTLLLTSCNSQGISDSISSAISNALPNLWVSLAQLGAFLVTVFIFFKFAYKPIKKKMQERNNYVDKNIQDSNKALQDATAMKELSDSKLKEAHKEANKIVEQATLQAKREADEIKRAAQYDIDKQYANIQLLLKDKGDELERQAHNEIVSSALDASKEILSREFTYDDNEKIVDEFIDKMKKENN